MTLNSAPNTTFDDPGFAISDLPAPACEAPQSVPAVPGWHKLASVMAPARDSLLRRLASRDLRAVLTGATQVMAIRMIGAAVAYVSSIFLARWLGGFQFGIYAYVWVWMLILALALPLGYTSSAMRFIPDYFARGKWRRLQGFLKVADRFALGMSLAGAAVGAVLIFSFQGLMESYYVKPFLIGLVCLPGIAMLNQTEATARSFGWLHLAFVPGYIVRPILLMAIIFAMYSFGLHPTGIDAIWAIAFGCIVCAFAQWWMAERALARTVPDAKPLTHAKYWTAISLSFVSIDGFRQILENGDVLMIGRMLDPSSVAAYYAAVRTGGLIAFIYFAVVALAAPRFAKIHISGTREEMQRFVSGVIQLGFWPSLAAASALALFGPMILSLFGTDFERGYPALLVVLGGLLVRAATGPVEYMLNMTGHHNDTVRVYGICAAACIAGNLLLIPALGIVGAALSSYMAIAGANVWLSLLVRKRLGVAAFLGFSAKV